MHILPQLRQLEEKFRDFLVVIGVHSAKFDAEKGTAGIQEAVARYNVRHPVVNDADFDIWKQYGLRAWPTLMFIDPEGKVIGRHEGEFAAADMDRVIQKMLNEHSNRTVLSDQLLPFQERAIEEESRPLSFPGKIEVDEESGRLFIADSGHHRVLVASLDGEVEAIIGNGEYMLYIASPDVQTVRGLIDYSMHLSDIPMHDTMRDLILLNQSRLSQQELK